MHSRIGKSGFMALAFAASTGTVFAQAPAPESEHSFSANVGIFSEYIFRGIAQTAGKPAVQGGFDYSHASGFYLGTWATNVSWLEDFGAYERSSLEWDFYGGFKWEIPNSGVTLDGGLLYYYYPGRKYPGVISADNLEVYASVGWEWISGKLSYSTKDYFGARPTGRKTDGTIYYEVNVAYPFADSGVSLLAHYGYLDVKHDGSGDGKAGYSDWRLGLSYVFSQGVLKDLEIGAYYSGNNAKKAFYTDLTGYDTSKDRGVVYVKKTF